MNGSAPLYRETPREYLGSNLSVMPRNIPQYNTPKMP